MKELIRFIKTTGIYVIGNVLTKLVTFLMLPIYTKYLNPTDFGTYDVNIAYITFLSSVLFLDIWSGVMRYMFDFQTNSGKSKPIISGFIIFMCSTMAYAIFTFTLGNIMSVDYLFWVFAYGLVINVQSMFAFIIRGLGKSSLFAISGLVGSIVTIVFNIIFIAIFHGGYQFLYISSVLGACVNVLMLLGGLDIKEIFKRKNYDKKLTVELLVFSLPLTINSVSWWFLTAFNRVAISHELSLADNGLYAVANKFSSVVQLVDQAFQMAWQEISFMKSGESDQNDKFFSQSINEYIKFMIFGISLLLPVIKVAFPFVVNSSYSDALNVIPLALVATLFSSISSFLGGTLTAIKKNRYLFTTTLTGTIVNVVVIVATIGVIKIQAASLALGLGFLTVDIRRYSLLKKYIHLQFNFIGILLPITLLIVSSISFIVLPIYINAVLFFVIFLSMLYAYRSIIKQVSGVIRK